MPNEVTGTRGVHQVVDAARTVEGGGFIVRRPFPRSGLDHVDPFLLLDEMGPVDYGPGQAVGAPDHPHRGFETVTYILEGAVEHKDSAGNRGVIGPGDVQWMTAGAGVVHSEMPVQAIRQAGGRAHGFQLWVNLPKAAKMSSPRYQDLRDPDIPVFEDAGVRAKVIAGAIGGLEGIVDTHVPITYVHYTVQPGGSVALEVPRPHNVLVYAFAGEMAVGPSRNQVRAGQMAVFDRRGDTVDLDVPREASTAAEWLLLAGEPIEEPVARYGPFVMNTKAEIVEAFEDYESGRLGRIEV